ncbi:MAG: hypothetical protein JWN07_3005 [Hyphomicrobiales bacterium]|nr:hypothetical protein [Hyphomicrobiales bacterium]
MLDINLPDVVEDFKPTYLEYQKAVDTNDIEAMNKLFWKSPQTVRFGPVGSLIGYDMISSYRRERVGHVSSERTLRNTVITTFGRDFAVTNTETLKQGSSVVGRQSQSWIRTEEGWRIAAAHVSDQPGT